MEETSHQEFLDRLADILSPEEIIDILDIRTEELVNLFKGSLIKKRGEIEDAYGVF